MGQHLHILSEINLLKESQHDSWILCVDNLVVTFASIFPVSFVKVTQDEWEAQHLSSVTTVITSESSRDWSLHWSLDWSNDVELHPFSCSGSCIESPSFESCFIYQRTSLHCSTSWSMTTETTGKGRRISRVDSRYLCSKKWPDDLNCRHWQSSVEDGGSQLENQRSFLMMTLKVTWLDTFWY